MRKEGGLPDREAIAKTIKHAAERFADEPARKKRSEWRQPYAAGLRLVLLDLINDGAWKDLLRLASDVRKESEHDLKQMARQQDHWRGMSDGVEALRSDFAASWRPPDTYEEWVSKEEGIVEELVAKGMGREQATEAVVGFGRATARDVLRYMDEPISVWESELEDCTIGRFAALAAADLSDAVGKFNRYASHPPEEHVSTSAVVNHLLAQFRELHEELKGDSRDDLEKLAKRIEAHVDDSVESLLRGAAHLAGTIAAGDDAGPARAGVAIADAIRQSLLLRTAARVIAWTSGWTESSASLRSWRAAARDKPFATVFQPPQAKHLGDLAGSPPPDGRRISVEGWMGPVGIAHHGRKVISTATITDRAGHTLQVGLPYIKLDSGGIVANTYVRFAGTYHPQHHDFEGPVFIPARRSLTHDSRHSWMDWLTLTLMPLATPVAHNLCGQWSWAPGSDGAANPLRYGTWRSTRKGFH